MADPIIAAPASGVGEALAQALAVSDEYTKPFVHSFVEPDTGIAVPALLTRAGVQPVPDSIFDDYRTAPKHRRGTATLTDLDSFIEHVQRFQSEDSVVYANDDRTSPGLTAVLDYHPAGATSHAAFGKHRSAFKFPLSDEWKAWHRFNGQDKAMGMLDFAEFLEDRITDVEHPQDASLSERAQAFVDKLGGTSKIASPTRLLELSQGLSINENSTVKQANKLQSGEGHVVFNSQHVDDAGIEVDIPSMFVVVIPVFKNGAFYRILARLRYRLSGGSVRFWYELWRTDLVFDDAFNEALVKVADKTTLPVLRGSPEA